MNYDESIRVMIKLISLHPISVPLTEIPDPPIPLRLLYTTFDRINIEYGVLETRITSDRIIPVHKSTFLKAIGISENPKGFKSQERLTEYFQTSLNHIRYAKELEVKTFKKSIFPGLWTAFMHLILRGLFGKHGGTNIMSKDWLYVVYNIFSGKTNVVDLTEVL